MLELSAGDMMIGTYAILKGKTEFVVCEESEPNMLSDLVDVIDGHYMGNLAFNRWCRLKKSGHCGWTKKKRHLRQVCQGGTAEASCSKVALKAGNATNNSKIRDNLSCAN